MNNIMMFVKITVLTLGFILVVFLMTNLGKDGLPPGFLSVFGLPSAQAPQTLGGGIPPERRTATLMTTLDWCETRVAELELRGGFIVRQVNMKWMGVWGSGTRELGDITIEKWFSRNCKVNIEKVTDEVGADIQPYMTVKFVKGDPVTLMRSVNGFFKWRNEVFRSSELENAIAELAAKFQSTSGG